MHTRNVAKIKEFASRVVKGVKENGEFAGHCSLLKLIAAKSENNGLVIQFVMTTRERCGIFTEFMNELRKLVTGSVVIKDVSSDAMRKWINKNGAFTEIDTACYEWRQ